MSDSGRTVPGGKAVAIGLDGATWTLLDRFIDEGVMPTLGRLRTEGTHGPLWSVVPPMTATAWTSYQTGKGPGKHGIFDWTEPVAGTYLYRPIDSNRVQSRTLFEDLSARGKRVATVNLPLTYPARAVNGIAVGDMLTPSKESPGFTWPATYNAELDRLVPDYAIDTHLCEREDDIWPFLERLRQLIDARGRLVRHLMEQEPWDFFTVVWVEMDRMQHCLWHIFDDTHPRFDARLAAAHRDAILDIYRLLDTRIAEMLERRPPDANVYFLSDHGFGYCRYKVFLNKWLAREGFLRFKEGGARTRDRLNVVRGVLSRAGIDTRKLLDLARSLGGDRVMAAGDSLSRFAAEIDWEHTQAFCHGTNAIRLNVRGRDKNGSVDPAEVPAVIRALQERLLALSRR
jgi:predicted AlkP superfamily phosphohydrolase/phosphomutase